jgi:hypothetical protein
MRPQIIKKPTLRIPLEHYKMDPIGAVAILASFTAKYQGGNRLAQDNAALIAVSLLTDGMSAVQAIETAVTRVMQSH